MLMGCLVIIKYIKSASVPTANEIKAAATELFIDLPIFEFNAACIGNKAPTNNAIAKNNILFIFKFNSKLQDFLGTISWSAFQISQSLCDISDRVARPQVTTVAGFPSSK